MARQKNDGRGRLGGRAKGVPNKITGDLRTFLSKVVDDNREQIVKDLECLQPRERLLILERFMNYIIPKQQSVKADVNNKSGIDDSILARLDALYQEE